MRNLMTEVDIKQIVEDARVDPYVSEVALDPDDETIHTITVPNGKFHVLEDGAALFIREDKKTLYLGFDPGDTWPDLREVSENPDKFDAIAEQDLSEDKKAPYLGFAIQNRT